jgi:hypothetical protein
VTLAHPARREAGGHGRNLRTDPARTGPIDNQSFMAVTAGGAIIAALSAGLGIAAAG